MWEGAVEAGDSGVVGGWALEVCGGGVVDV